MEWSLNSIKLRRKKASKNNIYIFRNFFCLQSWMPRRCGGQVYFYRQHSGIVCYHKYLQHHCCGFSLLSSIAYFLIDAYFLLSLSLAFDNFATKHYVLAFIPSILIQPHIILIHNNINRTNNNKTKKFLFARLMLLRCCCREPFSPMPIHDQRENICCFHISYFFICQRFIYGLTSI